jgi:hypothetical protein
MWAHFLLPYIDLKAKHGEYIFPVVEKSGGMVKLALTLLKGKRRIPLKVVLFLIPGQHMSWSFLWGLIRLGRQT